MNLSNLPFEQLFEDYTESAHADRTAPLQFFSAGEPYPCCICARPTTWISISFEVHVCCYACSETLWADYLMAEWEADVREATSHWDGPLGQLGGVDTAYNTYDSP